MRVHFLPPLLAAVLSACTIPMTTESVYHVDTPFDEDLTERLMTPGDGKIDGTAFMRQRGGGVVTCAGSKVTLTPATEYSSARMFYFYGAKPNTGEIQTREAWTINPLGTRFEPEYQKYIELSKSTVCDAQGNFVFEDLADGEYYISTAVLWNVGSRQGGYLLTKAKITKGKSPRVIMSH